MEDPELVITTNSLKQSSLSSSWEGGVVPGVEGADNNDYALVIRRWKNRGHDRSMNSAPLAAGSRQTLSTLSTSSRPR